MINWFIELKDEAMDILSEPKAFLYFGFRVALGFIGIVTGIVAVAAWGV
jgi:hypothetical protein